MAIAAAVGPACSWFGHDWKLEHETDPIGTPSHFKQPRLVRFEATIPAGSHGQQIFDRLLQSAIRKSPFTSGRKEVEERLPYVMNVTAVDRQANQSRSDALRDRCHIMSRTPIVWIKIGVKHEPSFSHNLNAVN